MADHRIGVDLAHVVAAVFLLHLADMKQPGHGVVVGYREPRQPRDHVPVDGQDHLPVDVDPGHLGTIEVGSNLMEMIHRNKARASFFNKT